MNVATTIEADQAVSTDIVLAVSNDPGIVLLDTQKFDAWYEKLKAEAPTGVDITTTKGRDTLRSFAAKVRTEKAGIDRARLSLTKGWRDMVDQANAAGKIINERLEGLAIEVRAPLTEWEEAEKARIAACEKMIADITAAATVTLDDTAETVRERATLVFNAKAEIVEEVYQDLYERAMQARSDTIGILRAALDRLTKEEADRAELEKLRAENEAREAKERVEREAREQAEREAEEARQAEERRAAAEKAEQERIEQARQEAADAERRRVEQKHAEALAAERRRAEEAEAAALAERNRAAAEQKARDDAAAAEAAEQAKRERNRAHRAQRMGEAKIAIMAAGKVDEAAAIAIVKAIVASQIPHVSLEF